MNASYNLVYKVNPKTKEKMWYAIPASKGLLDVDETAKNGPGSDQSGRFLLLNF